MNAGSVRPTIQILWRGTYMRRKQMIDDKEIKNPGESTEKPNMPSDITPNDLTDEDLDKASGGLLPAV